MAANDSTTYLINVHENYDTFQLQELPVEGPVLGEVRLGRAREGDARDEGPEGESSGKGYNTLVPCMNGVMGEGHSVVDLEEFKRRFKEMTGGLFEGVDWSNIVVIGGSIVSSLMGRNEGFEESDVDVYLYGIYDKEEAGRRIAELRKHFMKVAKGECATMRTPCTITMGFGKPYRNIQVITSPWASVDHILSTCDVDCSAVGFDGHAVYATPRARLAFNHRISAPNNRSLRIRGSNSYSKRLVKYCKRGFSVVDFFTPPDTLALYYPGRNSWTPRHIKDADFPFLTPSSVVVEKAPKTFLHKSDTRPATVLKKYQGNEGYGVLQLLPYIRDSNVAISALFNTYSNIGAWRVKCGCGATVVVSNYQEHLKSSHKKRTVTAYYTEVVKRMKGAKTFTTPVSIEKISLDGATISLKTLNSDDRYKFKTLTVKYTVLPFYSIGDKGVELYCNHDLLLKEPIIPVIEDNNTQTPVQKTVFHGLQYINDFGHFRKMCLGLHCAGKWGVGDDVTRIVMSFCDMTPEKTGMTSPTMDMSMPNSTLPVIKAWCRKIASCKYLFTSSGYGPPTRTAHPNNPGFSYLSTGHITLDNFEPIKDPYCGEKYNAGQLLDHSHPVGSAVETALLADKLVEAQADLELAFGLDSSLPKPASLTKSAVRDFTGITCQSIPAASSKPTKERSNVKIIAKRREDKLRSKVKRRAGKVTVDADF
eukprot:TRINITY_DN3123_c0_g1_i8.p1 TRINITY_DN3123_c0_g1~~TRINITY_DN3123_c0_g1_i8.p1  ORF type:complete len:705 (+),score=165.32 TRINITY_DN3123_c0_g1_i8:52-2166(+)